MVIGTTFSARPSSLSGRASQLLAEGPLDALTLMREVCQVRKLQVNAAERMAAALLGPRPEFVLLPTGHWALAHLTENRPGADAGQQAGLHELSYAVVDVETTGTRAGIDRITEIAIVQVGPGGIGEVYSQLVNPGRPIPQFISALTHITWDMVRDQPSFAEIAQDVIGRLRGAVFVAHNAAFDWGFVSREVERATGQQLAGPRLCTVRLTRALLPQLTRRSLDHLSRHLGIEIADRHRAAGDAVATAKALCRLLEIAEDSGLNTLDEISAISQPRRRKRLSALPSPTAGEEGS